MNTLFEKSIRTLELPVVLEMLASLAVSEAAKEKCRQLLPVCDLEEAARLQEETQSARERLGLYGSPSFSGVKDVSRALNRAGHGGVLDRFDSVMFIAPFVSIAVRYFFYVL